jgi:hypothetical protein
MKRFAGLDVSLSTTSISVVDDQGQVVFEGSVATDPDTIAAALAAPDLVRTGSRTDVGVAARGPVATGSQDRADGDATRPCGA